MFISTTVNKKGFPTDLARAATVARHHLDPPLSMLHMTRD